MKRLIFIVTVIWIAMQAAAYDFKDGDFAFTVLDKEAKTCRLDDVFLYWDGTYKLQVPAEATDGENIYTVTSIAEGAFSGKLISIEWEYDYSDVVIPPTVTEIGKKAFMKCRNLYHVTLPESLTQIADSTFLGCYSLKSINIPPSLKSVGTRAFYGCTHLNDSVVKLPESVSHIGEAAFGRCGGMQDFNIPTEITEIPDSMAAYSSVVNLKIPQNITRIGNGAFAYSDIKDIILPESLQHLGTGVFDCAFYLSKMSLPKSLPEIPDSTFRHCFNLSSISLPSDTKTIGNRAFFDCESLTDISLHEGLETIGDYAFSNTGITDIKIPGSVTHIGNYAFRDCHLRSATLPKALKSIGEGVFMYNEDLTSIDLPPTLSSIDDDAFAYCGLTDIAIPDGVTELGGEAFSGCWQLRSVSLPETLSVIGIYAFAHCSSLNSFEFPDNIREIGEGVLGFCENLESIEINESNPYYSLVDGVLLDREMTTLLAYPGARKGTYIVPNSVTTIGDAAFAACAGLTDVTLPEGLRIIGADAFNSCMAMTEITFPESLEEIGFWAFYRTSLKKVVIPESCVKIDSSFEEITALEQVWILGDTDLGHYPFWGCDNVKELYYLPEHLRELDYFSLELYNATLYVRASAYEETKHVWPWYYFEHIEIYNPADDPGSVTEIFDDSQDNRPVEVYTTDGIKVADSTAPLRPGLYIIRKGNKIRKVLIK